MQEVTSNEAGNGIKTRDIVLLKVLACILILFFTLRFLVFPGLEKNQDLQNEKEQVRADRSRRCRIQSNKKSIIEKKIVKVKAELANASQGFMICLRISRSMNW